jgi:CBS domain-containing protein
MRARDVMTRAVATTTPETTVEEAARLMINLRISGVAVLDRSAGRDRYRRGPSAPNGDRDRASALALERVVFAKFPAG